jgi:hypothetical protein
VASVLVSRYAAALQLLFHFNGFLIIGAAQIGRSQSRLRNSLWFSNEDHQPERVVAPHQRLRRGLPRCGAVEVIVTFRGSVNGFLPMYIVSYVRTEISRSVAGLERNPAGLACVILY